MSALLPTRFYGKVKIDSQQAAVGTPVTALVGGTRCAAAVVQPDGSYVLDVLASPQGDSKVTFAIGVRTDTQTNDVTASEESTVQMGAFVQLDLSATTSPAASGRKTTATT